MGECFTNSSSRADGRLVEASRQRLETRLHQVIEVLADGGDSGSFFATGTLVQELLQRLRQAESESDLLLLMLDISVIGFQGFDLTPPVQAAIDTLLVECESIATSLPTGD